MTIDRPRVKFCGMTRREDAVAAADLGADAVGFVFWERSPRYVTPEAARAILQALPPLVWRVGVFVDAPVAEIRATVDLVGLDVVQLHGHETPEVARVLAGRLVKALDCRSSDVLSAAEAWGREVLLLVDAVDRVRRGGTGQLADWTIARELSKRRPIVLAGGLTPDNVASAVATVRPYGVDVTSGVEARPGVKDIDRMRAFMRAVLNPLSPLAGERVQECGLRPGRGAG
jgi:phosphoribosylanthranilate isomerase